MSHAESAAAIEFERPSRGARALRALRHREFRLVFATFTIGQFGFWISFISLQALMARLTHSSGTWLGLVYFVNFFPMLLFTPVAGVVADRVERKRILIVSYAVIAVVTACLAALTLSDRVTPASLLPFAFAIGSVFAFNAPASQSIVSNAVPRDDIPSAISLGSTGANLARVLGPTLAAPILAIWNEGAAFAVYAVTSVLMVFLLPRLRLSPYTPDVDDGRFFTRLRRGIDHARERPPAVAALSLLAMSSMFAAAYLAVLPVMADRVFHRGPSGFATLAAVTGVGSMIGAFTTAFRESQPTLRSTAFLVAAFGASIVAFALAPSWPLALAAIVVVGGCYFSAMTTLNTLLQYLVDEGMRGRVSSLFVMGWAGLVPLGGLWQGVVAGTRGARFAMTIAGAVTCAYALVVLAFARRGVREAAR